MHRGNDDFAADQKREKKSYAELVAVEMNGVTLKLL